MRVRTLPLTVSILVGVSVSALADQCTWSVHAEGESRDGRYRVRLDQKGGWKAEIEDTKTGKKTEGKPEGLDTHAHFDVFVTDDGSRIAVFEPSIDRYLDGNLLVYDRNFKLLKAFTLRGLLTQNDFAAVRHSISHFQFTRFDKDKKKNYWLEDDGKTFAIHLKSRRTALVSLTEPKIIETKDVAPEVFEFEEGAPSGKTDQERVQGKWMVTDLQTGFFGIDPDALKDDPRYFTFQGDTLLVPSLVIDQWAFRLDDSVTPHTIDFIERGKAGIGHGIYEFKEGTLRICFDLVNDTPRPKTFGEKVKEYSTYTLKRRKVNK